MHFHFTNGIQGCQQKFDRLLKYHRSRKYVPRDMGIFFAEYFAAVVGHYGVLSDPDGGGLHHR